MAHTNSMDYPTWTKRGFLLGVAMFLLGEIATTVGPALMGPLPGWERTLFFDITVLGILLALLAPIVFGVILPLTE